jgi:hypothetical protein
LEFLLLSGTGKAILVLLKKLKLDLLLDSGKDLPAVSVEVIGSGLTQLALLSEGTTLVWVKVRRAYQSSNSVALILGGEGAELHSIHQRIDDLVHACHRFRDHTVCCLCGSHIYYRLNIKLLCISLN